MRPGPSAAVRILMESWHVESPPRHALEILAEIIREQDWPTPNSPDETAESWLAGFVNRASREIADAARDGKFIRFSFNSASEYHIQGSCFAEPKDSEDEKTEKKRRSRHENYYTHLSQLTPDQFEHLSGKILELFRATKGFVTRRSADQGIDFFGRVEFGTIIKPSAIAPGAESQLKIWLVGQAKHYSASQVSTKDIRELVGSIELARSKTYAGRVDPLADLDVRICDPIFYLFFTTGSISRDGSDLLRKAGIVSMDGRQLAVFLADHQVAIDENGDFSPGDFQEWLKPV